MYVAGPMYVIEVQVIILKNYKINLLAYFGKKNQFNTNYFTKEHLYDQF